MKRQKTSKNSQHFDGPLDYASIRSALIQSGTNLKRWAESEGLPIGSVYHAARGSRAGVRTTKIRTKLLSYARSK